MRFEWLALLAYTRKIESVDGGWVTIKSIQGLPLWRNHNKHNVGTNVGRYIRALEDNHVRIVEARTHTRGPYRLTLRASEIIFDVTVREVGRRLEIRKSRQVLNRKMLFFFTQKYSRAASLFLKGRLSPIPRSSKEPSQSIWQENARDEFSTLAEDGTLDPRLRAIANLAAVRVMDRRGLLSAVTQTLDDSKRRLNKVHDPILNSRFSLASAWNFYRTGYYDIAQHTLDEAKPWLNKTVDSSLAGEIADREGLHLSAVGDYAKALDLLAEGLYARLLVENYDAVQASCFNIGNTLHRMGPQFYEEAEEWLKLSADICHSMRLGRYEALTEIILAKIALETGRVQVFLKWIRTAERFAARSNNAIDISWCHIMRAFYFQTEKRPKEVVDQLVKARRIYYKQNNKPAITDAYLRRKFGDVWDRVIERF